MKKYVKKLLFKLYYIVDKIDYIKNKNSWVFPVYFLGKGSFNDNILAVYDFLQHDKTIKKIVMYREEKPNLYGENVIFIKMDTWKALYYLLTSKVFVVQHSLTYEFKFTKLPIKNYSNKKIFNLWHGIAIKDISNKEVGFMTQSLLQESKFHHIFVSSEFDRQNMQKAFYNTKKENFHITGLPRNDFLLMTIDKLPTSIKKDIETLQKMLNGRKLFSYMPTYRDPRKGGVYYDFKDEDILSLQRLLNKQHAVFGYRYHPYNPPTPLIKKLRKIDGFIDLNHIENASAIIRSSDVVITDYSSVFLDALYAKIPVFSFAYDLKHYLNNEHGFFYDYTELFPGSILYSFNELIASLENYSANQGDLEKIKKIKALFFKYIDTNNAKRVIETMKELT